MGVRIDALDATAVPSRLHEVPAMKDGLTVRLSVEQIMSLIDADDVEAGLVAATSDDTFADTDEVVYLSSSAAKRGTLTGLISSIFKTARTIANAQFASATFKLFNAAGTPRALTFDTAALTADRVITVPDASVTLGTSINLASPGATTSGTSVDFTGIPSTAKRVTLNLSGISTNGTSDLLVQGGTSGGVEASGYAGSVARFGATALAGATLSSGLNLTNGDVGAGDLYYGKVVFEKLSGNLWTIEARIARSNSVGAYISVAGKTFAAALDRVRLTTSGGANTFDAGTASISWET